MLPVDVNAARAAELHVVRSLTGTKNARYGEQRGGLSELRRLEEVPGHAGKIDGARTALTAGETN
ncbi:helix-hairpin-helix domain-containing protein [Novosphingobium sp. RD2P27]|uniref:Helix-hairpin-helix domain-containing protein n=1 Tax=Novosphingobium kalidii TaxID=3230299 RepID=A0ABV2CX81_9SPHN